MEMTIKEYAESRKVTYEAVRKQVNGYKKKELKKHITYQGRQAYLDDFAVDFLDKHRQKRNVVLNPTSKEIDAEIDRLREQVSRLQEEILRQSEESKQILKDNNRLLEEQKKLIEDKTRSDTLLLLADKEHEELQEVKQELSRYQRTLFGLYRKI